jgi:3-hydroxyisobutyrate dehydrogenase-like beta-hydroxyacid dehydrogenase
MKVSVIGLGLMGTAVAEAMIGSGHEVTVYNRTAAKAAPLAEKGAQVASSAAEAVRASDATLIVLTDGAAVRKVLTEDFLDAVSGKKVLNVSTTGIEEILEYARMVSDHGGSLSELSIMTGPDQVKTGQGYYLLGCPEDEEGFWNEVLGQTGYVQRVGDVSLATKSEAPIVIASLMSAATLGYAAAAIDRFGVPEDVAMATVGEMVPGAKYLLPSMLRRDYDAVHASTESLVGVADAAIGTAEYLGFPSEAFKEIRKLFVKAVDMGYGAKDSSSIVEVLLESDNA